MCIFRLRSSLCFVPCCSGCAQSPVFGKCWWRTNPCCFGYAVPWSSGSPMPLLFAQSWHKKPLSAANNQWKESHRGICSWEMAPGAVSLFELVFPPCHGSLHFWWFHESVPHQLPQNTDLERSLFSSLLLMFPRVFFSASCEALNLYCGWMFIVEQ